MARLDKAARALTDLAMRTLEEAARDEDAKWSDRISAANSILDRGYGKPVSATIQIPASKELQAQLSSMSDDDLLLVVESKFATPDMITVDQDDPLFD
jgi:hypothetical protein